MKSFQNAATVAVTSDRDHVTKHGLHLNRNGEKSLQKPIASLIKEIFKQQKQDLIKMSWKERKSWKELIL